jgi:uncharacterized membrane protein YedE/YeeE
MERRKAMFYSWKLLVYWLFTGFVFGFLLQKGQVTKFSVIVNQFLLRYFTVLKTMLTAIIVGGIGVYALRDAGLARLHIKSAVLIANVLGGLIFGVGMALLGYCPGTCIAAVSEKSRHAIFGVLGMLVGAAVLAETYSLFAEAVRAVNLKEMTLPTLTGLSAWVYFGGLLVVAVGMFTGLEVWEGRRRRAQDVQPESVSAAPEADKAPSRQTMHALR